MSDLIQPFTQSDLDAFEKWKVKSEYNIGLKKMGEEYKAITRWLRLLPNKDLEKWRKSVGEEVADYIMEQGAKRGIAVHEMINDYLNISLKDRLSDKYYSVDHGSFGEMPYNMKSRHCLYDGMFMNILHELKHIKEVFFLEDLLYSDKYKIYGRVDCIAKFHSYYAIIDFKTSRGRREKISVEQGIQLTAYACMFNEMFNKDVKDIVVIGASEDGGEWAIRKEIKFYIPLLEDLLGYKNEEKT